MDRPIPPLGDVSAQSDVLPHREEPPSMPTTSERKPIPAQLLDPHGVMKKEPIFPGHKGVPFRGAPTMLKQGDRIQPKVGAEAQVVVLDLSKPDDLLYYQQVWQLFTNQVAFLSSEEKVYCPEIKNWRVFLRWGYKFTYMSKTDGR